MSLVQMGLYFKKGGGGVSDQHSMHEYRQQIHGEDLNRSYDFLPTLIKKTTKHKSYLISHTLY